MPYVETEQGPMYLTGPNYEAYLLAQSAGGGGTVGFILWDGDGGWLLDGEGDPIDAHPDDGRLYLWRGGIGDGADPAAGNPTSWMADGDGWSPHAESA